MTFVDLSGASPSSTDLTLPAAVTYLSTFGAYSSSQWVVGDSWGILLDGTTATTTPRYFGYGAVTSIAGSSNNIAIATAIGKILLYDPTGATQQGAINFQSGKLELSSDGSILAASAFSNASQYQTDRTLNLYSLPSLAVTQSFPSTFNYSNMPFLSDYSLSASGQTVGQVLASLNGTAGPVYSRQVTGSSGSPVIWSDTDVDGPLVLSPNGTNLAAGNEYVSALPTLPTATLWSNGTQVTAVAGLPEGWTDNTHLLAANYTTTQIGSAVYAGSTIYDSAGNVVTTLPANSFPGIPNPSFTSNGLVYDEQTNAVYSLSTGSAVWIGPSPASSPSGAVAGSNVVYVSGHQVFVAPY